MQKEIRLAIRKAWMRQGRDVYCYFNNDQAGYAVENTLTLQAMAGDTGRSAL